MRRALLLLVWGAFGCNQGCEGWNNAFQRMVDQPKYEAYGSSGFFEDGRAMQPPPLGAISREETLGPPELVTGLANGTIVDRSPIPVTAELLARGRNRFNIYCAACHGIVGDGDSVVARNMQLRQPPSLLDERIRRLKIGDFYRVATYGYGLMPAYNYQLTIEERWGIAAYVRALQMSQGVPISSLPTAVREEALRSLK